MKTKAELSPPNEQIRQAVEGEDSSEKDNKKEDIEEPVASEECDHLI